MEKIENKPSQMTWDNVADSYSIEIHPMEKDLSLDIISLLDLLKVNKGATLLEVGSGSGHLSCLLAQNGYDVTLLDFSKKSIEKSKLTFEKYNVQGKFINLDLMDIERIDNQYDLVWNSGVMEHFDDKELIQAFKAISKVTKKYFLILVPNPKSFPYLIYRYKAVSENQWNFGTEYLRKDYSEILKQAGFNVVKQTYLGDKWTKSLLDYFFEGKDLIPDFEVLLENNLIPEEEKYLVAYIATVDSAITSAEFELDNVYSTTQYTTTVFDLICNLNQVRKSYEGKLSEATIKNNTLKLELDNLSEQYVKELLSIEQEIKRLTNELEKENLQKEDILNKLEQYKNQIDELEKKMSLDSENIDKLMMEINNNEEVIKFLKYDIKNNNCVTETLIDQLKKKDCELNNLAHELSVLRRNIDAISQENNHLRYKESLAKGKIYEINNTKYFRTLHGLRRLRYQFVKGDIIHKKQFLKWFGRKLFRMSTPVDNRYNPLFEIVHALDDNSAIHSQLQSHVSIESHGEELVTENHIDSFQKLYEFKQNYYRSVLSNSLSKEARAIINNIKSKEYKAIVVYPEAVHWEPMQRPQQILRELAQKGYLCFFCDPYNQDFKIREEEENLFIVNNEGALLEVLKHKHIIVICSWLVQMSWADLVPSKTIWYDVLDKLEFFSMYDEEMLDKHKDVLKHANFVSYTAKNLKKYVIDRKDAIYLPNGCNVEDFVKNKGINIPLEILTLLNKNKKIIGYFGAVEEWFDLDLIREIAARNDDWEFVIIGKVGINIESVDKSNISFLGLRPYQELVNYAKHFDVCIIPFKVNDLTNSVSPVKFFEYASLGKPIVSTPILEMKFYESDYVRLAKDARSFEKEIKNSLAEEIQLEAMKGGKSIADENQWRSRVEVFEKKLNSDSLCWAAFANINHSGSIAVKTATFLDFEGKNFYSGGAERYLIDLHKLSLELGVKLSIFQYGNFPWMRKFQNIDVISLSDGKCSAKVLSLETVHSFNKAFYNQVEENSVLNIYSAFFEGTPLNAKPSIGISHGVAWDNPNCKFNDGISFWQNQIRFIDAAKLCSTIVSVDTNTANWFQTIDFDIGNTMKVIPNYVDLKDFNPRDKFDEVNERIVITYPRRLYSARGLYLVLEILDYILDKYPQVDFHFVGKGFEEDTKHVVEKQKKWGDRVQWYSMPPEQMSEAYKKADISLIPTIYSEGTSLSCLEAMASGNAVIATRIGGLTDLVINNYNGYLIDPNSQQLKIAIESLLKDHNKMILFKKRAIEVAKAFDKGLWEERWSSIIKENIKESYTRRNDNSTKLIEFFLHNSVDKNREAIGYLVTELLQRGYLLYIRTKGDKFKKTINFGRIQWLSWDEESLSQPNLVISDTEITSPFNKKVDLKLTEDLLAEWSKSRESMITYLNNKI